MTIQLIVPPAKIESELTSIWEKIGKEKTRASLFNLIVFNRYSQRTDYIRNIVQKIIGKFPCRILFISEDPEAGHAYLKTAVSLATPDGTSTIACDHIDIGAAGPEIERVPSVLLPHILPDLPVVLLWAEDPAKSHPLFAPLSALAHRIIFDSESTDNLPEFAKTVLALNQKQKIDVADLNWARIEGWRDLLAFAFDTPQRVEELKELSSMKIVYNGRRTEFFCHLKIQSLYLTAWLMARLNLKHKLYTIESALWEQLGPGAIISVELLTKTGASFVAMRKPDQPHSLTVHISSKEKCDLPYHFLLGQTATGASLVQEICKKGTSHHYLEMLTLLAKDLC